MPKKTTKKVTPKEVTALKFGQGVLRFFEMLFKFILDLFKLIPAILKVAVWLVFASILMAFVAIFFVYVMFSVFGIKDSPAFQVHREAILEEFLEEECIPFSDDCEELEIEAEVPNP
jgi:hypothetical protein